MRQTGTGVFLRLSVSALCIALFLFVGHVHSVALAQGEQGAPSDPPDLTVFTRYPVEVTELGETVNFDLTLSAAAQPETARLEIDQLPEGWTATFRGGGHVVEAVYVEPDNEASVSLRLEPPEDVAGGTYDFLVRAVNQSTEADLPLEVVMKEKLPPKLALDVDLPTLRGTPSTTFRYDATLHNEGDEDLTVNLAADAPQGFQVTFKSSGKEVTTIPLAANATERLSIEADPFADIAAGTYDFAVRATGGDAEAGLDLTAEVTGQPELSVTGPNGRLSGDAYAGQSTPIKVIVQNTGSAPARGIEMSSSTPSDWTVKFDPSRIDELAAGTQQEVTAQVQPAEKAVAGDYMVTVHAQPEGGTSESAEFRITVLTSTLWGVVGIGLVAVAVIIVGLAVMRFGRR